MKKTFYNRIEVDPAIMVGKPVFKGTRLPVHIVLDLMGDGITYEKIMEMYSDLTLEDIMAAIKFASSILARREFHETA